MPKTLLEAATTRIWLRGKVSGKDAVARAKAVVTARKTLRDYIAHTGPHVSPAMHRQASEALTLILANLS